MKPESLLKLINWVLWPSIVTISLMIVFMVWALIDYRNPGNLEARKSEESMHLTKEMNPSSEVVNGIHVATGLLDGEGLQAVVTNCTGCHSAKLIIQNRMDAERWRHTIHWMQRTQNLWDLGAKEDLIVNYLATYYAPENKGRRPALREIEWYVLVEN
jgi:hypothetical protein